MSPSDWRWVGVRGGVQAAEATSGEEGGEEVVLGTGCTGRSGELLYGLFG